MLTIHQPNRVTFNVNVFGTASTPTVRCVVGEAPGLTFPAVKLGDGQFEVLINLPPETRPGAQQFKIEVLLNGRLFTPIQTTVPVTGDLPVAPTITVAANPPAPEPELPRLDAVMGVTQQLPEEPAAPVEQKLEAAPVDTQKLEAARSLIKDLAASVEPVKPLLIPELKPAEFSALAAEVKKPVEKLKPRAAPQVQVPEIKSVKITMAAISEEADKRDKPAKKAKPAPKAAPVAVKESAIPVSLTKGDIVYL